MNRIRIFGNTPPVVKNLIIINAIMLLATMLLADRIDLVNLLGMHYYQSKQFGTWQIVTHMFMHANFLHLALNMYGLWMFGQDLEYEWGGKKFLFYFLTTGIGAVLFNMLVQYFELAHLSNIIYSYSQHPNWGSFNSFINKYLTDPTDAAKTFITKFSDNADNPAYISQSVNFLRQYYTEVFNTPLVGASGAVFGVLLAFGMLYPNRELMMVFPPMIIKAKWAVIGYGAIELFMGVTQPGSDIAHFAHLGGVLFGFLLIKYWQTNRKTFY